MKQIYEAPSLTLLLLSVDVITASGNFITSDFNPDWLSGVDSE